MGDSKVKVAVRVRPMNRRELDLHTKCVVDVDANKVILHPVNTNLSKGDASIELIPGTVWHWTVISAKKVNLRIFTLLQPRINVHLWPEYC
uniref:Kinesin family member 13B n=1 Tax=Gallus gallus TaxID=9031 RepID=A0A8V0Y7Z3_CHICK